VLTSAVRELYVLGSRFAANDFIELLLRLETLQPVLCPARFAGAEEFLNLVILR
jgi:hypothetical protein